MLSNALQLIGAVLLVIMVILRNKKIIFEIGSISITNNSKAERIKYYFKETRLLRFGIVYVILGYLIAIFFPIINSATLNNINNNILITITTCIFLVAISLINTFTFSKKLVIEIEKKINERVEGEMWIEK